MDIHTQKYNLTKEQCLENFERIKEMQKHLERMIHSQETQDYCKRELGTYTEPDHDARWAIVLIWEKQINTLKEMTQESYRKFAE